MELLIVIINYNGLNLTIDCLNSLEPEVKSVPNTHIALCDNGSEPAEADELERLITNRGWDKFVNFTRLSPNQGFTGGNNAVIRAALAGNDPPDFVLLLNNDTIVRPGAIGALLSFMKSRPDVGIAGSRLEDPDGTPQVSAFRFLSAISEFDRGLRLGVVSRLLSRFLVWQPVPESPVRTDWVAGASMIIRRAVLDDIGLLDEGYFTYFDDIDYCFVARGRGWPTWYVPQSRIVHLVGKTTGVTDLSIARKRKPAYYFSARRRYLTKNLNPLHAAACDAGFVLGYCLHQLRCLLTFRENDSPSHTLRDHIRHSVFLRGFRPPNVANPALATANANGTSIQTTASSRS
jgi:GT2 family glycosyltransferase